MRLKYLHFILFILGLVLSSTASASVDITNTVKVESYETIYTPVIATKDNSRILITSGMSTMIVIWIMPPVEYPITTIIVNRT